MSFPFNFEERLQARIALLAIGRSTLRNQGASGMVSAARHHLQRIDLQQYSVSKQSDFDRVLEKETRALMRRFPVGVQDNWGPPERR